MQYHNQHGNKNTHNAVVVNVHMTITPMARAATHINLVARRINLLLLPLMNVGS